MSRYPCPRCGASASDETGCTACGTPPDRTAIELDRLRHQLADLDRRDFALRQEYAALTDHRRHLQQQITELQARIARQAHPALTSPGPQPSPTGPAAPSPGPAATATGPAARPETSTASVQTVLLVLGGMLLAVAAIVFTAVAWATFGVTGRAVILATITAVTLAVPVVLGRRELTATAETVAALALLLVLLDGYAAWTVNLAGVRDLAPAGYAALVFAATAVVAAGYQPVSRLAVPWFAALLCAQPVLPLLAQASEPTVRAHAIGFALTAAGNLAFLAVLRRASSGRRLLSAVAAGLFLLTAATAALLSGLTLALTHSVPEATVFGAVLVGTATLGAVAASGVPAKAGGKPSTLRALAAAGVAVAVVVAVARPVALAAPGYGLLIATATTVAVWALAWLLPHAWRTGPVVAGTGITGLLAVPAAVMAGVGAVSVLVAVTPIWHTDLDEWTTTVAFPDIGWQPLAALALIAAGSILLTGRYRRSAGHHAGVAGVGLVALAAPAGLTLPWWSPAAIGIGLGVVLLVLAARADGDDAAGRAAARAITGAVLLLHATAASLTRPGVTSAVLAGVAAGAAGVAVLAARPGGHRVVGGTATAAAVAVLPGMMGAAGVALHWPQAAVMPAMAVAAGVGLGIAVLLRSVDSSYLGYAVVGLGFATATTSLSVLATNQPVGVYAAVSGLIGMAAATLVPARRAIAVTTAGLPLTVALLDAIPAALTPAATYLWLLMPWHGVGDSTRDLLAPESLVTTFPVGPTSVGPWEPLTLALLTAACGIIGYGMARQRDYGMARQRDTGQPGVPAARLLVRPDTGWSPLAAMLPGAAITLLVMPIGYDWAWPALPVIALALAVASGLAAAGLASALLPRSSGGALPVVAGFVWPVAGSIGLANCLAVRSATLTGLVVATLTALLVAVLGRTAVGRVTGWIVCAASAVAFVQAAALIAELTPEQRAYAVLAVAVVLLAVAAILPVTTRRPEALTTERLSFAATTVAVATGAMSLTTVAAILAGYGALLGLSALRPGRWRLVFGGIGCELVAWWVFLWARDVGLVEAYTVPFAVGALAGGVLAMRYHRELTSWEGYGVALAAVFLPSLAVIASGDDPPARRLGLGLVALVVVVAGAVRRRQAPVVVGGAVLVLLALRELVGLWDLLPRWLPLAVAGLILLVLGATYEQRRRDVRRLRETLGRMT